MPFNTIANSTFLDAYAAKLVTLSQYMSAAAGSTAPLMQLFQSPGTTVTVSTPPSGSTITVGLILDRAADPSALLAGNWAQREAALAAFPNAAAVWSTYGARSDQYDAVQGAVQGLLGSAPLQAAAQIGYVSSAADRTIWLTLSPTQFESLFGQTLQYLTAPGQTPPLYVWTGNLGLDSMIPAEHVKGLWVEQQVSFSNPSVLNGTLAPAPAGPLGIGNGVPTTGDSGHLVATPAAIAANYNFPLAAGVATDPIALVETDIQIPAQLFAAYNLYRQSVGLKTVGPEKFKILSGAALPGGSIIDEVALDISVVAGALPHSTQLIYADFNSNGGTAFNAYQQAFFDAVNHPAVLSSSYRIAGQPTNDSPFQWAWQQLFVDGALANVSVHIAGGDQGSSDAIANGAANVENSRSSPFALIVGGTSIANLYTALSDSTLTQMTALARAGDAATIFGLVAAGLRTLPSHMSPAAPSSVTQSTVLEELFETVWQSLSLVPATVSGQAVLESEYGQNQTGAGGVASTPIPSYQAAFGLSSLTNGFRGTPDVAALATGDTGYAALNFNYVNGSESNVVHGDGGTSAAAPLWASLATEINVIFKDQGLPQLGFYNDLLYQAAALAPGSFNDVRLGNNVNSFYTTGTNTGYYNTYTGEFMTPTGEGYSATPGYDLASGLGTPNGLLLSRALTAIAHAQISSKSPAAFGEANSFSGVSTVSQTMLVQDELGAGTSTTLGVGTGAPVAATGGSPLAWTSRLAQQSLQTDFDPGLATLLDGAAQGTTYQVSFDAGQSLAAYMTDQPLPLYQASYTNPFGIVEFGSGAGHVTLARPVAVAQTAGGADNHDTIVRLRQVTTDAVKLDLYKVDDFNGTIGGIAPSQAGYAEAAKGRAYHTDSGDTVITGPGYGAYGEVLLKGVKAGDLVALHLTNATTGGSFWGFAGANERVGDGNVNHLWSYGLNTFGFEASTSGGDGDFNDLIVGIDFTSAAGHAYIA